MSRVVSTQRLPDVAPPRIRETPEAVEPYLEDASGAPRGHASGMVRVASEAEAAAFLRSTAGAGAAQESPLVELLRRGHYDVRLQRDDWMRLFTWMDTYGQRLGSFGPEQEEELRKLRQRLAHLLAQ